MNIRGNFSMIPREIYQDKELTLLDINIYGVIISLAQTTSNCFATNRYLADYFNKNIRSISASISRLKKLGYIRIETKYQRLLYPIKYITFSSGSYEI